MRASRLMVLPTEAGDTLYVLDTTQGFGLQKRVGDDFQALTDLVLRELLEELEEPVWRHGPANSGVELPSW
jgi:hypothetical protein